MNIEGCVTSRNVGAQRIMDYAGDDILGRSDEIVLTSKDRARGRFATEFCRALGNGRAGNERGHLRRDDTCFQTIGMMRPLLDAEGQPPVFLNILRERTDARAELERRKLMMAEMNHPSCKEYLLHCEGSRSPNPMLRLNGCRIRNCSG
jgi:hypothetical protein